jgi:type I restriction-modification system DNA methylase subunit
LLSRDSLEKGLIDKEAEKWGKKVKKVPVDKQLLNDLTVFRDNLNKNILKNNSSKNLSEDELDEAVQRLLDRLIFIRTLEDKQLEAPILQALVREDAHKRIYKKLNEAFRKIDDIYNSKLFTPHLCEELVTDDEVLEKIIMGLFRTSDNAVHYDFSAIDADVLGNIYELYLGHILKKTDKRAKLTEGKTHRKEQGIYYTPTYVVDYIVKNTVGELARNKKFDLKNIRVLDPACGSGSFLMKAFDYLVTLDIKRNGEIDQMKLDLENEAITYGRKVEILKNNIFGVDLDAKAVEIAQLNLLLKAAEKKHRLPTLQENIRVGNSLVDNQDIAGNKAFKWNNEFKNILSDGGFDLIIGNPPYVFGGNAGIRDTEKEFFKNSYYSGKNKLNLFSLFIEKSINLLKSGGRMGFIVPNTLLRVTSYEDIRKYILEKTKILQLVNLEAGVFEGVTASTIIIILQKEENKTLIKNHKIKIFDGINGKHEERLQSDFLNDLHIFDLGLEGNSNILVNKLHHGSINLGTISKEMIFGVVITKNKDEVVSNNKIDARYKKFLEGKDMDRYKINFSNKYLLYEKSKLHRARTPEIFEAPEKILVQRISGGNRPLKAAYDNEKYYNKESINNIILSDSNYDAKYVLALLNSKLFNWFYATKFTNGSTLTVNVSKAYLSLLPVKVISLKQQQPIINLVDKILSANKRLIELNNKTTDEKAKLQKEIDEAVNNIDQEIYKIYGLSKEDISVIEDSMKPA